MVSFFDLMGWLFRPVKKSDLTEEDWGVIHLSTNFVGVGMVKIREGILQEERTIRT